MNSAGKTTYTSRRFKSFSIQDILGFSNGGMSNGEKDRVNSQMETESIQDSNVLGKKKQGVGKTSKSSNITTTAV
jgi:hypothetical protein